MNENIFTQINRSKVLLNCEKSMVHEGIVAVTTAFIFHYGTQTHYTLELIDEFDCLFFNHTHWVTWSFSVDKMHCWQIWILIRNKKLEKRTSLHAINNKNNDNNIQRRNWKLWKRHFCWFIESIEVLSKTAWKKENIIRVICLIRSHMSFQVIPHYRTELLWTIDTSLDNVLNNPRTYARRTDDVLFFFLHTKHVSTNIWYPIRPEFAQKCRKSGPLKVKITNEM